MGPKPSGAAGGMSGAVLVGILANISSTVAIVGLNKFVLSRDQFFVLSLSFLHFVTTSLFTTIGARAGLFVVKDVADVRDLVMVAACSTGSVAFMNLNLSWNSVGFYQLSKLVCIPATLAIQYHLYGSTVPTKIKWSLAVILTGVSIATVTDVQVNAMGTVFAGAAVACTTLAQIFTSQKQKVLQLDAMQLLYHTSPMISVGMFVLIPFFDDLDALRSYEWTTERCMRIFTSCACAVVVNISNYLVLGKTSPITYQVVGHFKTLLILCIGFVLLGDPIEPKNLLGIATSLGGVIWYSELKRRAAASASASG